MPVQIPINELVVDKWYVGRGRNANVGMWDGHHFLVISEKFEDHVIKREPYYTAETGCFQPFAVVDEGVVVEPFGTDIWDKHYGRRLEFGMNQEDPGNIRAKSVATRESESDTADLISQWKASIYLPDGVRSNVTLVLNADKTFLYEVTADHSQPDAPVRTQTGVWLHAPSENLLILRPTNGGDEQRELLWRILQYTGSTMMLRWLALASRNLPILFYRVHVRPQVSPNTPKSQ